MPHTYTEDQLVEWPANGLWVGLCWTVAGPPPSAGVAGEPRDAGLLVWEAKGAVVLVSRLRAALERLNASRLGYHALSRNYSGCSLGDYVTLPTNLKLNPHHPTKL